MKKHLLAVDIGNTSISFGIFRGRKLIKVFRVATGLNDKETELQLRKNLKKYSALIEDAIICSVVPKKTIIVKIILRKLLGVLPKIAGEDIKIPIKNLYKNQRQVGKDRLVAACACKHFYGAPAVVIDFGTAITFDYVNKNGEYEGGIISPGIEISLDALAQRTALLPRIKMRSPREFLGKSTTDSITSGAANGLSLMCDGIIRTFKMKYSKNIKVIATGGYASFFKKRCAGIDLVDKNLILKGLFLSNDRLPIGTKAA
ncbi:MAG: type III pantothenate kinase [Candidatus Omnitrophota bacterium]